jgi:hypothetical protein
MLVAGSISVWFDKDIPTKSQAAPLPPLPPPPALPSISTDSNASPAPLSPLQSSKGVARFHARRASVASFIPLNVSAEGDSAASSDAAGIAGGESPSNAVSSQLIRSPSHARRGSVSALISPGAAGVYNNRISATTIGLADAAAALAATQLDAADADALLQNELSAWRTMHHHAHDSHQTAHAGSHAQAHTPNMNGSGGLDGNSTLPAGSPTAALSPGGGGHANRRRGSMFSFDSTAVAASLSSALSPASHQIRSPLGSPSAKSDASSAGPKHHQSVSLTTDAAPIADGGSTSASAGLDGSSLGAPALVKHRPARVGDRMAGVLGDCVGLVCAGSERFTLGELGLIERIARTATLRAEEPVLLLRIDAAAFERSVRVRCCARVCGLTSECMCRKSIVISVV